MSHLPELIKDLSLILMAAGLISVVFKKFKGPLVLGHILAGFLVGPNFSLLPTVSDVSGIKTWGEIGVIFLLFALGLEFSFKKLFHVGGAATITAFFEVVLMALIGFLTGHFLGWSKIDGLFLGGILAISSTTIIIRAFEELKFKGNRVVSFIFGILIIEDLVAVLLLTILSTVAMGKNLQGQQMLQVFLHLIFFLTLWFVSGIFFIPTLIKKLKTFINDEIMLLVSAGLCFLMVTIATKTGFSPALGAFVMGSILAETAEAEKIAEQIRPVKNLFAAIFFVSVGMLLDLAMIMAHWPLMLLVAAITIVGKILSTWIGAMIAGQGPKRSLQAGMSLAQIGEFSFIIASLGQSLQVTSHFLYPLVVGVSAITTMTSHYFIKISPQASLALEKIFLARWPFAGIKQKVQREKNASSLLRSYFLRILLNGMLITAIFLITSTYISPFLKTHLPWPEQANFIGLLISVVFSVPFLWTFATGSQKDKRLIQLWQGKNWTSQRLVIEIVRILLALVLGAFLASQFIPVNFVLGMIIFICSTFFFLFSRHLDSLYNWFEAHFLQNFKGKANEEESTYVDPLLRVRSASEVSTPWDAHIVHFDVHAASKMAGKTLAELHIKSRFGVSVILMARGPYKIVNPRGNERIYPFDRLYVLGTDEQIFHFREELEKEEFPPHFLQTVYSYSIHRLRVPVYSYLCQKNLAEGKLGEKIHGQILGIERGQERILDPDTSEVILEGDILWVVGDGKLIKRMRKNGEFL